MRLLPPRFRCLFTTEAGSSTIQTAILIALIIGGAFLALDGLGFVANKTFSTTSTQLSGEDLANSNRGAGHAAGSNSPARSASATGENLAAPPTSYSAFAMRLIVLLVACPLGALCWYLLNRKDKKQEEEEQVLPVAPQSNSEIERDLLFDKRHNLLRLFNADIGMLMTSRIMVKHVMSEKVQSVLPGASVAEIRDVMNENNIRHVLVRDKNQNLLGIVTVRALEDAAGKTASEIMENSPPTVEPTALLNPAITQIIKQRLYCLPVVKDGVLLGVLTSTDVMLAMQCTLHALQKTANEAKANLPEGMVPGFMVAMEAENDTTFDEAGHELAGAGRQ